MICQPVALSGYAEWPKVADAVIEALIDNPQLPSWCWCRFPTARSDPSTGDKHQDNTGNNTLVHDPPPQKLWLVVASPSLYPPRTHSYAPARPSYASCSSAPAMIRSSL